jgi:hypothetical protein
MNSMALTMPNRSPTSPVMDWLLVACLIGLVVAARLFPHAPNFTPVVAAGLFAGMVLRSRTLALLVPVAAMVISDLIMGFEDWRIRLIIYAALVLPVILGIWGQRFRPILALVLRGVELRGVGVQRHVHARLRRPRAMLRAGAAVPAEHRDGRCSLDRRAVRKLVARANLVSGHAAFAVTGKLPLAPQSDEHAARLSLDPRQERQFCDANILIRVG